MGDPTNAAVSGVPPATSGGIETTPREVMPGVPLIGAEWRHADGSIVNNADVGYTPIRNESGSESPISSPSDAPSRPSMRRYRQPKNVREFASQANAVASAILNGEIDLDTARAYSAVARTVAQAVTSEVVRARFLKAMPDLDFVDMSEEPDEVR